MKTILTQPRTNTEPLLVPGRDEFHVSHQALNSLQSENDARNEDRSAFAPKIILVPLALSGSSHAALVTARNLACESQAKLVLLHVVQLNIAGEERGIQRTRLLHELCRSAEFQLQQLADGLGDQVAAEILVCEGTSGGGNCRDGKAFASGHDCHVHARLPRLVEMVASQYRSESDAAGVLHNVAGITGRA